MIILFLLSLFHQPALAATVLPLGFLSDCDRELQGSDESYMRLLSVALSVASNDSTKFELMKRVLTSAVPASFYAQPHSSKELQIDLAVRPLLQRLTTSQWQNVKARVEELAMTVATQNQDRRQHEDKTSQLLQLVHVPEYDIESEGGIPSFLDMGDYELSVDHLNSYRVYKINKDTGFREVIGSEPFGMFMHYPILFRRAKNQALSISISAGFRIHVMKIDDKKVDVIQSFELRDANRLGHFRLPDGRDIVTIQIEARSLGVETFKMNIYEVGADGKLTFKWQLDIPKKMTEIQTGHVVETDEGPVLNLHALSELGHSSRFELHLDSLVMKNISTSRWQFDRKPFQKITLKDGTRVFLTSDSEGVFLFDVDSRTGFPVLSGSANWKWDTYRWSGHYFKHLGRDFIAASAGGEIGIFEIIDKETIVQIAHQKFGDQNTMHGFGLHIMGDGRVVIVTSIGDAVQLFEFRPHDRNIYLVDEIKGSLQSQNPHFVRSVDGKDDFVLVRRKNRLETFRLKKKLERVRVAP